MGAGQSPGSGPDDDTTGNGRATALLFAREGAKVLAVDRRLASAQETVDLITSEGGIATPMEADICDEVQASSITAMCLNQFDAIDILHNNVGIGAGDGGVTTLELDTWNRIYDTNVTGMFLTCKHAIPAMRASGGGAIVNISSVAAIASAGIAAYKTSKAAVNALTQHLAAANFKHNIRVNAIMPGLMDTPMAVGGYARARGADPDEIRAGRNRMVHSAVSSARHGIPRMPRCSWRATKPDSSPACCCPLTAVLQFEWVSSQTTPLSTRGTAMNSARMPPLPRDEMSAEALAALGPLADRAELDNVFATFCPTTFGRRLSRWGWSVSSGWFGRRLSR